MSAASSVLEDGTILSMLDQKLNRLESFLALVTGLAVFLLMLLAVASVSSRNFFGIPLVGYLDWIEQIMPLIAFMGVAYTQRDGGHIRMDILVGALKGRALWAAEIITTSLILILIIFLIWGTFSHFLRSFDFGVPLWSRDSSMDIALPIWPAKLLAPIAFSVLGLRLMLQIWGFSRAFMHDQTAPVAVPLVESAAEQAAREALTVSGGID